MSRNIQLRPWQQWRLHLPTQEMLVRSQGQEDPLGKEMATHSSIVAWKISGTEKSGWLQSMGLQNSWLDMTEQPNSNNIFFHCIFLTHISLDR